MPAFLSPEWFEQAIDQGAPRTDHQLVIEQQIRESPYGSVSYLVVVDGERAWLERPGSGRVAHVTFTVDYDTAAAMARGELSAQRALMQGRLRVRGSTKALLERPVGRIDPVPAALRRNTTF
jgi:SCP-2 sterol transfer family